MNLPPNPFVQDNVGSIPENFWQRLLSDEQLNACSNLEKLLAGCEIIATLDEIEFVRAA